MIEEWLGEKIYWIQRIYKFARWILLIDVTVHYVDTVNKNQSFTLDCFRGIGLQTGAELGQHPTVPPGLTSKLLKDTFARIKSCVGCALQHMRLSGLADVGK